VILPLLLLSYHSNTDLLNAKKSSKFNNIIKVLVEFQAIHHNLVTLHNPAIHHNQAIHHNLVTLHHNLVTPHHNLATLHNQAIHHNLVTLHNLVIALLDSLQTHIVLAIPMLRLQDLYLMYIHPLMYRQACGMTTM